MLELILAAIIGGTVSGGIVAVITLIAINIYMNK